MRSRIVGNLGIVVLMAAMLSGCNRGGESSSSVSSDQIEGVVGMVERIDPEQMRFVGHQAIDLYASFLKIKVDFVVNLWGHLSPEERRNFMTGLVDVIKMGEAEVDNLLPHIEESQP